MSICIKLTLASATRAIMFSVLQKKKQKKKKKKKKKKKTSFRATNTAAKRADCSCIST